MLLTISGPSTVGKDATWVRIAQSLDFYREIPYTTRPRRNNEIEGIDHWYISVPEFQEKIRKGKLAEWDYVHENYYGTDISLSERTNRGENIVLQVLGRMGLRLRNRLPNVYSIMLISSERETLEYRLSSRGYTGDELKSRLFHWGEEYTHAPLFDLIVPDADIMTNFEVTRILQDILLLQQEWQIQSHM